MRNFVVEIELDSVQFNVRAKSKAEAKRKALARLAKKNPKNLIRKQFSKLRKKFVKAIFVHED